MADVPDPTGAGGPGAPDAVFAASPHTTPSRHPERASYSRQAAYRIIDEALVCHVAYLHDARPVVLPTLHVRLDDVLYLHGSVGATLLRAAAGAALPVCVSITLVDALVLAASQFNHSVNYRSVTVHGAASLVADPQRKRAALTALVEHVVPGRSTDSRPPSRKELAATAVLAVPLEEVSVKSRSGGPGEPESADEGGYWHGLVHLRQLRGPVHRLGGPDELPGYLRRIVTAD